MPAAALAVQDVSAVLKNPAALPAAAAKTGDKMPAEFILRLQDDLVRCARADVAYSPFSDMARQIAGGGTAWDKSDARLVGASLLQVLHACMTLWHCVARAPLRQRCAVYRRQL